MMAKSSRQGTPTNRQASVLTRSEKKAEDGSAVDRWWRNNISRFTHRPRSTPKRFEPMLAQVRRFGEELVGIDDPHFDEDLSRLRQNLYQQGLTDENIARSFAYAREASGRSLGLYHFDCLILGALAMLRGNIAEMQTGEGKTLAAVLTAATAALAGIPTHVITVNDYLTERDANEMSPCYARLGLTVGFVVQGMSLEERQAAYSCDVTYCTNNELVFDFLKDSLVLNGKTGFAERHSQFLQGEASFTDQLMLRGLHFAVVDEADSVLLDEARTPLIISGELPVTEQEQKMYREALEMALSLDEAEHYQLYPGQRRVELLSGGEDIVAEQSQQLGSHWQGRVRRLELIHKALQALHFFDRDNHYLVDDGKVIIIDEHTGRLMPDRSWESGLHQLIEVKEECELTPPRQTLARISYQHFFRRYHHLSGMTGTAKEVTAELWGVYKLPVVTIPTNRPCLRHDFGSFPFTSEEDQMEALVASTQDKVDGGRAVLIGTTTVAQADQVSEVLSAEGIQHQLLTAKHDSDEAAVVATAGQPGSVIVATSMAGRGTDIKLHPEVHEAGGLHVILTRLHEAGRIDRQLAGRAARQGDPGSSESIVTTTDIKRDRMLEDLWSSVLEILLKRVGGNLGTRLLAVRLLQQQQKRLEQQHTFVRRQLLRADEQNEKLLAFASEKI